jgi:endonuclease-3
MANDNYIHEVIKRLREAVKKYEDPIVTQMVKKNRDPFKVLISTIISLRTKDEVTREASKRLYELAETPEDMAALSIQQIEDAIFPAGFYHNKAQTIIDVCRDLIERFDSKTPDTIESLLTLKGVGRKTANLVITLGYGKPGICVDTHVHRISNRIGYVSTKNPDKTEFALREKLPKKYWIEYNDLLVTYGQNICKPISPICSECTIYDLCERKGVKKHR